MVMVTLIFIKMKYDLNFISIRYGFIPVFLKKPTNIRLGLFKDFIQIKKGAKKGKYVAKENLQDNYEMKMYYPYVLLNKKGEYELYFTLPISDNFVNTNTAYKYLIKFKKHNMLYIFDNDKPSYEEIEKLKQPEFETSTLDNEKAKQIRDILTQNNNNNK